PHAMFYNLFCCSTLRYTISNFLGGSYIYDTSATSLGVIGSTKTGSMLVFSKFYQPLGLQESFGESFRQWFNYLAPYNTSEREWHFGMTIAGDPFLRILGPVLHWDFPEGLPSGSLPPGAETVFTAELTAGDETYQPGTAQLFYRFDSGDAFHAVALTTLGGDLFEARIPGALPGDEPEFYLRAETDRGNYSYSPKDAPGELYAFDICFKNIIFSDDFETDQGWNVESTDIVAGEWERAAPQGSMCQPFYDHSTDGTQCYVTGMVGIAPSLDDVDGGPTRLISPAINASNEDTVIEFFLYFYHSTDGVQEPLLIDLSNDNGNSWTNIAQVTHTPKWTFHSYRIADYLTPTGQVKIRFTASDNPDDDLVEALVDDLSVYYKIFQPTLWADAYTLSVAAAATIDFTLDAGSENGGRPFLVLGGMSGTSPGFALPGGKMLPLNWDIFTDFVMDFVNSAIFQNFLGTLDVNGKAATTLDTLGPLDPILIGVTSHYAYLLGGWQGFNFTSNPIPVVFEP
ncbi:MAG: hypothetical protein KJ645_11705, partial [Planctomycetes bacterium]|nr:hypothetical protein [Planctomycetota bacterium]